MKPYYQRDGITIYHGDCRLILPTLPMFDLVLTDPPYGIGEARGKNKSRGKATNPRDYGISDWDDAPPPRWLLDQVVEKGRASIIYGGNYFGLAPASCWLVWDKDNDATDFADCELAWTNLDKAVRKIRWRWNGMLQEQMGNKKEPRVHPTQKPLAVMKWSIQQAPEGVMSILDPFMGSGTTLRAAKDLGKDAVGIEINEAYCEAAARRLDQQVFQFTE